MRVHFGITHRATFTKNTIHIRNMRVVKFKFIDAAIGKGKTIISLFILTPRNMTDETMVV